METPAGRPFDHDDHLLELTRSDGRPRVKVYPWSGVAVVIGRGGKAELELDLAAIIGDQVPLFRRRGGGCAVVLDPGNVIVSVALPWPGLGGIKTGFAAISSWLCSALEMIDIVDVQQLGVSDLAIGDRKIGGSCIWRTRGLLYYSTTLLVDPDLDLVERYLPHPPREPDYRQGRPHRQFMGSIAQIASVGSAHRLARDLEPLLNSSLGSIGAAPV